MKIRFAVSLLLCIGFQSIALVSQGSNDGWIQLRDSDKESQFVCNNSFNVFKCENPALRAQYDKPQTKKKEETSKIFFIDRDPLDLEISKEDTVIAIVGDGLNSMTQNNTNLFDLVGEGKGENKLSSCLICRDVTGARPDCYVYNASRIDDCLIYNDSIDSYVLEQIASNIASNGKKNIIFRFGMKCPDAAAFGIAGKCVEAIYNIVESIGNIEKIGVAYVHYDEEKLKIVSNKSFESSLRHYNNSKELVIFSDATERLLAADEHSDAMFECKSLSDGSVESGQGTNVDSYEDSYSTANQLNNFYSGENVESDQEMSSAADEYSDPTVESEYRSRWSSWFSFFKSPTIVISFVTASGVCLGTLYFFKNGWFTQD